MQFQIINGKDNQNKQKRIEKEIDMYKQNLNKVKLLSRKKVSLLQNLVEKRKAQHLLSSFKDQ